MENRDNPGMIDNLGPTVGNWKDLEVRIQDIYFRKEPIMSYSRCLLNFWFEYLFEKATRKSEKQEMRFEKQQFINKTVKHWNFIVADLTFYSFFLLFQGFPPFLSILS